MKVFSNTPTNCKHRCATRVAPFVAIQARCQQTSCKAAVAATGRPQIAQILTGAALSALAFTCGAQPALAGKTFLDLPECTEFRQAGAIKYCDVREGSGAVPEPGDLIKVDFTAREMAGDNVYDGSRGFTFTVGQQEVIAGWEQAILGNGNVAPIKEGGIRTVYIPANLAFGARGSGCSAVDSKCRVPPNTDVKITFQYQGLGY